MASTSRFLVISMLLLSGSLYSNGCYTSIISFGDSIADTGSLKQLASISDNLFPSLSPPYGDTFFHKPTGRCSNGRLIIDFLAESLGLPLIPPFVHDEGSQSVVTLAQGVNYAVAGATAVSSSFLDSKGIQNAVTNASLEVQLAWFKQSLPSLCANTAETLVVPGKFPTGCSSAYLTQYISEKEEYDTLTSCLVRLNEFAKYHNGLLQTKLNQIRELHPNVNIIYADYYKAAMEIYRSPDKFGFTNGALRACCGGGGPFNYNSSSTCGEASATVCDLPDTHVSWDGVHITEAAYKLIFKSLFQGPYTKPPFSSLCPTLTSQLGVGLSSFM